MDEKNFWPYTKATLPHLNWEQFRTMKEDPTNPFRNVLKEDVSGPAKPYEPPHHSDTRILDATFAAHEINSSDLPYADPKMSLNDPWLKQGRLW